MRGLSFGLSRWFLITICLTITSLSKAYANYIDAETYAPFAYNKKTPTALYLYGEIDSRAGFAFRRALNNFPEIETLVLASPGGLAQIALTVSEEVFERKINTFVPKGEGCYSSCTYIFFAGNKRVAEGELGVHQITAIYRSMQETQLEVSDIIDALARYGIDARVLAHMFRTKPENLYIFDQQELAELSINRSGVGTNPSQKTSTPASTNAERSNLAQINNRSAALSLVRKTIGFHELTNTQFALTALSPLYAETIRYFGEQVSNADLSKDKADYFRRWEKRKYQLKEDSIGVDCRDPYYCTVRGLYDWEVFSPSRQKSARGTARFEYGISKTQPMRIVSEGGGVVSRN